MHSPVQPPDGNITHQIVVDQAVPEGLSLVMLFKCVFENHLAPLNSKHY